MRVHDWEQAAREQLIFSSKGDRKRRKQEGQQKGWQETAKWIARGDSKEDSKEDSSRGPRGENRLLCVIDVRDSLNIKSTGERRIKLSF